MDSEEKENKNCKSAFTQKRSKLLVFRRDERIPEDLTLLSYAEKEVSCVASIVSEAREKLRVKVQNLGGNAVLNFSTKGLQDKGTQLVMRLKGSLHLFCLQVKRQKRIRRRLSWSAFMPKI